MVSLPVDLSQFQLNGFSYVNCFVGQRCVFLRLVPISSREDGVYPNAGEFKPPTNASTYSKWGKAPYISQKRRNTFWGIVIDLMLEGKFVKDWKQQNSQCC